MKPILLPMNQLRPALIGFGKVITKRTTLPVLSCVRLQRHASGAVDLTVTDLDHEATCRFPSQTNAEPLTLLIPLEDLNNVARSGSTGGAIEVEPFDASSATLRFQMGGQNIEHRCETCPPAEFPCLPDIHSDSLPLPANLREAVQEAMACASTDSTRLVLNGTCLDVTKPDAHYVVATDGRHLFAANSFNLPLKENVVIPDHKFLGWKGFYQDGEWRLKTGRPDKQNAPLVILDSDHWRFVARGIDGNFPNWQQVIPEPSSFQTTITIEPESLDRVVQAAQSLPSHDNRDQTIGLEVADGVFHLLGKSRPEMDWTRLRIDHTGVAGPDVTVLMNRTYLLKALRFGLNRIELIDPVSPIKFCHAGRLMIAMPLRPGSATAAVTVSKPPMVPSAQTNTDPVRQPQPQPSTTQTPMNPTPPIVTQPQTQPPIADTPKPPLERALDQTEAVRTGLRELLQRLTPLSDSLRQALREQRAGDKDLHSVRQTLRSLQNVRI
jgi:DNA polymerase III sliding clamp (beta) subunit (PCNA family)